MKKAERQREAQWLVCSPATEPAKPGVGQAAFRSHELTLGLLHKWQGCGCLNHHLLTPRMLEQEAEMESRARKEQNPGTLAWSAGIPRRALTAKFNTRPFGEQPLPRNSAPMLDAQKNKNTQKDGFGNNQDNNRGLFKSMTMNLYNEILRSD